MRPLTNVSTMAATRSAAPADRNAIRPAPRRRIPSHAAMIATTRIAAMIRPRGKDRTELTTRTTPHAANRARTAIAERRLMSRA